jgi:putative thioredoxin
VPASSAEYSAAEALLPLAQLIAQAQSPDDGSQGLDAMYRQAGQLVLERRIPDAIEALLDLLRKNRNYGDGQARQAVLALIAYLGDDPNVKEYRRRLASVLF